MINYSKLGKSCSDHAVGIAQVNQFGTNLQSIHNALAVEHGTVELTSVQGIGGGAINGGSSTFPGGSSDPNHDASGHHNTPLVPRGVCSVKLAPVINYGIVDWTGNSKIQVGVQTTAGVWYFNVPGLAQMWGRAQIVVANGTVYSPSLTTCVQAYDVLGIPGLIVCTYSIAATNTQPWALTQQPFTLTIYGHATLPIPSSGTGAPGGGQAIRQSLGPRRLFPWFRRPG